MFELSGRKLIWGYHDFFIFQKNTIFTILSNSCVKPSIPLVPKILTHLLYLVIITLTSSVIIA